MFQSTATTDPGEVGDPPRTLPEDATSLAKVLLGERLLRGESINTADIFDYREQDVARAFSGATFVDGGLPTFEAELRKIPDGVQGIARTTGAHHRWLRVETQNGRIAFYDENNHYVDPYVSEYEHEGSLRFLRTDGQAHLAPRNDVRRIQDLPANSHQKVLMTPEEAAHLIYTGRAGESIGIYFDAVNTDNPQEKFSITQSVFRNRYGTKTVWEFSEKDEPELMSSTPSENSVQRLARWIRTQAAANYASDVNEFSDRNIRWAEPDQVKVSRLEPSFDYTDTP